jgi:hypothetical protein
MMPSPPIGHRYDTRHSRWLAAGRAQARIRPSDPQPAPPQNLSATVRTARLPLQLPQCLQLKRPQQPMRSSILLPDPATKSP